MVSGSLYVTLTSADPIINVGYGVLERYFTAALDLDRRRIHDLLPNHLALVLMITAVTLQSLAISGQDSSLVGIDHEQVYDLAVNVATPSDADRPADLSTVYVLILRCVYMKYALPEPERHQRARFASKEARWVLAQAVFQTQVIA